MKHSLKLLLVLLISISTQAQTSKNEGYVEVVGKYDIASSKYEENVLSGKMITFEEINYLDDGIKTVRIEFIDGTRTYINEYIVTNIVPAKKVGDFNVYFMQNVYKDEIVLKYTTEKFEIFSSKIYIDVDIPIWLDLYAGTFFN